MKALNLLVGSMALASLLAAGNGYGNSGSMMYTQTMATTLPTYEQSDEQKADLLYMWEEEKLAKDVYLKMYEVWGASIFQNIANSELQHQNAVATLLDKYSIVYPSDEVSGIFQNSTLQALYDKLVAKGSTSLDEALAVGILIEETDIADLEAKIVEATDDVKVVYENLLNGSYNHLAAFQGVIDGTNVQTGTTNTNCDSAAMLNATGSGWHLVGTSYSGCTVSGMKAQGAKAVYRYSSSQNGWVDDDTIAPNEGFWIYK